MTCLGSTAVRADTLAHIGTFTWESDAVVGLSGLEVSEDGNTFYAVGDRGWYLTGTFDRQEQQIVGMNVTQLLPILGNNGLPVSARRIGDWSDAEGLAIAPDGTFWISFERWAHVSRYSDPEEAGQWIKDHETFYDYRNNRQLEALAVHPDGTLYTFPERPAGQGFPIYRLDEDQWSIQGHIAEQDGFSIVGADFDEAGQLYLLERKLIIGLWWQNRVRRLEVNTPEDVETLWTGGRGEFFNVEGIAVWRDEIGPRLTMVSDNNADPDEPTQFIEFRVDPVQ
ncbi:esterase-like activity of phytase family protein [Octadecabacter sp. CECT 8868]|uniref:esterase-like activity of phytase family protein n=1 Tax=Octadecabacter algicola TaxID=2909342 RepID=UPI001F44AA30|nr:esterase-like activity of phytase family protein [Octadecabacter algicola]MCF2906704.1 esterase-like activity of phytase family protein [Octadecabacter algicola]